MLEQYGQKKAKLNILGREVIGRAIVLPMPPSENERLTVDWKGAKEYLYGGYYSSFTTRKGKRGVVHNSTHYNRWKNASVNLLKKGKLGVLTGDVVCLVTFVFPDNRKRDADNRLKGLFDSFTQCGQLIEDDCKITLFSAEKVVIPNKKFVIAFVFQRSALELVGVEINKDYLNQVARTIEDERATV